MYAYRANKRRRRTGETREETNKRKKYGENM